MTSSRWAASLLSLVLLLGPTIGLALSASDESPSEDRSPLDQPFEEDVEKESRGEFEEDDDDTTMLLVASLKLLTGRSTRHPNEERPGTVEAATHQLHAPRAPPAML